MLADLEKQLHAAGYVCFRDRNLGPACADLYATKDAWWSFYPCYVNYYVFEFDHGMIIGLEEVRGFEALVRAWTVRDCLHRPRPWYRPFGGIVSILILWCPGGVFDQAVRRAAKPLPTVIGHTCVLLLFDPATSAISTPGRSPIVGRAIIGPAIREASGFLRSCSGEDGNQA